MFKRLKDRIVEEANTRLPGGQLNSTPTKLEPENKVAALSSEDLITLSDSPSVVVPLSSSQQFSIGDDDGSLSEQSTPRKKANASTSEMYFTPNAKEHRQGNLSDLSVFQEYRPSKVSSYVPQSDIESEREEPPTLNLDGISKNQLFEVIQKHKARLQSYKNKYSEVTKNYKDLKEEKIKIENTLIENQDRGLRRIAELREQCTLEQKAKAHLEENLQLLLEEKDSRISVLETQINLLKNGNKSAENCDTITSSGSGDVNTEAPTQNLLELQEKVERLEHVLSQSKNTIVAQKNQIALLRKQNESLSQELETKVQLLNGSEDKLNALKSEHESILASMQGRLEVLEKQQEESVMSMAETKRNMHEELELKEKQLVKAEEEARQYQAEAEHEKAVIAEMRKQNEENISELQSQLANTEKTLEDEKKNLMQELTRGKTAAVNLMQQELAKKHAVAEEEWKAKLQALKAQHKGSAKQGDVSNKLLQAEEQLKSLQKQLDESISTISDLKNQNTALSNTIESLKEEALQLQKEGNLKCAEDKFQQIETNYKTQLEELKLLVQQLEKEKTCVESENNEKVKSIQSKLEAKVKDSENKSIRELRAKEEELKTLREKYEKCNKEISAFQESIKDKENMILKLKANLASGSKENSDKVEELNRRVKQLEQEQERLMLQAQERVSATESKCREQIHEKSNQMVLDKQEIEKLKNQLVVLNSQLDESLLVGEANRTSASKEISQLKNELKEATNKLTECKKSNSSKEAELTNRIQTLEKENHNLREDCNQVERLKAEKDQLNETLKSVEAKLEEIGNLKSKVEEGKTQILSLTEQLNALQDLKSENELLVSKLHSVEQREKDLKKDIESLESKQTDLSILTSEVDSLKKLNESLKEKISLLEQFDSSDPNNAVVQQYMAGVKAECEAKEKLKEAETEGKLKQLVKDFCVQMDTKDKEYEQMMSELTEKNENLEEKLRKEHQMELSALRQDMFEKDCAIEEMRDHYVILIKEKDQKINSYESTIKNLSQSKEATDSAHLNAEGSDWDDTWAVPEESCENASPLHNSTCETHMQQIAAMQEELDKCQSEIKELRILLRLSPPQSLVANNNHGGNTQPIPEPTEFEYLRNIIYEYMMGKEPVTLVKVIAAVLRFSEVQTQQVIRKEESRHPTK